MNEGFCQKSAHGFTCICQHGYTGAYCEKSIDDCAKRELNSALCLNGGICVDGPGHTFDCRLVFVYPQQEAVEFRLKMPASFPGIFPRDKYRHSLLL
ncbi:Protein eyes shut-like protein [Plecturocebus cupreus]